MTDLSNIRLFATHPHNCSYLEGEEAVSVFVDPELQVDRELYSALTERGFRRSGHYLYTPHCRNCNACIATRVPASLFERNRRQRKCWNRNQDLRVSSVASIQSDEHYELYQRYICERHSDGDMYPPTREQYEGFLTSEWGVTQYLEFRLDDRLLAVAVTDSVNSGFSAVYTFYDPLEEKRSLGVFALLWQLEMTKQLGAESLYLGYWIKKCPKMRYKTDYRPLELYIDGRWLRIN